MQKTVFDSCYIIAHISSDLLNPIERGFRHFVRDLDDITDPLQILDWYNSFESYGSKLGCRSLWDTLYDLTTTYTLSYFTSM